MPRRWSSSQIFAEAWLGRGTVLNTSRYHGEAVLAYEQALASKPDLAKAWPGRGNAYSEFKPYEEALAAYDRALALKPHFPEVWFGRGKTFSKMGRHDDALAAQEQALAMKPDFPEAWLGRGVACLQTNREAEALANIEKALEIKPDFRAGISYRIFVLDFANGVGIAQQQEARQHWWREIGAKIAQQSPIHHTNSRDPDRRIKVGYVSADFRFHSAALSFRPMMQSHDKAGFEITCYYNAIKVDEFTDDFQRCADRWRNITRLSDEELCQQIQDDQIRHSRRSVRPYRRRPARCLRPQTGADFRSAPARQAPVFRPSIISCRIPSYAPPKSVLTSPRRLSICRVS